MNFCGGELDHQVHDTKLPDPDAAFCGPSCVKEEDELPLDKVFSEEDEQQAQFSVEQTLDVIQETLERDEIITLLEKMEPRPPTPPRSKQLELRSKPQEVRSKPQEVRSKPSRVVVMGVDTDTVPPLPSPISTSRLGRSQSNLLGENDDEEEDDGLDDDAVVVPGVDADQMSTAASGVVFPAIMSRHSISNSRRSPSFLNTVEEDWIELARRTQDDDTICLPRNGRLSSIDGLLKRLENGFRVQFHHRSPLAAVEEVLIYLTPDRTRLCLRSEEDEKKDDDHEYFWQEIPVADILRLEIGGKTRSLAHPMTSFSIVIGHGDNVVYHHFEADSPIEREIIVSTLMVVLEQQAQNNQQRSAKHNQSNESYPLELELGGTMDQPIPCSPSLEVDILQRGRTVKDNHEIINLEDVTSPQQSFDIDPGLTLSTDQMISAQRSNLSRASAQRSLQSVSSRDTRFQHHDFHQGSRDVVSFHRGVGEDALIEFDGSGQLASAWCADDICTLALKDIADTCTGIFALKHDSVSRSAIALLPEEQRHMIEEYVTTALGAPSAVYAYLSEFDVWRADTPQEKSVKPSKLSPIGTIRNRATILNAQANRLRKLRNEMTFAAVLKHLKEDVQYVHTTQSFDDDAFYRNKQLKTATEKFQSSALLKSLVGNMAISPPAVEEEIVYYDSDPEDARTHGMHRRGPRKVVKEYPSSGVSNVSRRPALSGGGFEKISTSKRLSKKLEEETISHLVQAMVNERLTLMWHPTQDKKESNKSPLCVKMWIECGVSLIDGTFLLPKLSWSKAFETERDNTNVSRRRLVPYEPHKVDLLDICRIRATENIDRRRHPFATARKSFFVETQSSLYLFEAQSLEECERIVYGLKLVVARLASLLMLRDIRAAEEFFGAIAITVPGEPPEWAQTTHHQKQPEASTLPAIPSKSKN